MPAALQGTEQRFNYAALGTATPSAAQPAPRDALVLLEQFGTTILVKRDRQIHGQGEQADYCYKILRGCVRTVNFTEDGRRQVGEFLVPGDFLGFDTLDTYDFGAEALCDVVLRRYPRQTMDKLADSNIVLTRRLRDMISISLRMAHARMLLGRKTASERIATFLIEMEERLPTSHSHVLDLPMTRGDIADHLGLTIETVCRVLAHLRRDGMVTINPNTRGSITIRDGTALREMASETRH